jgi:16S rRNA (cytosine967-C5)-methyltransferase
VKFDNQLRHATAIIGAYKGEMPLHAWLKNFFRDNKQMGSRDRKLLSTLVYGYYRLGHSLPTAPTPDRLLAGLFLCHDQPNDFLQHFYPDWNDKAALPLEEKILFYQSRSQPQSGPESQPPGASFRVTDIFPWPDELSAGIDHHAFCLSFLRQPDLFLRIRPGFEKAVRTKLDSPLAPRSAGTAPPPRPAAPHEFIPPFTLRLPNGFKVEDYFTPDHEIVIQDYSSQRLASFFPSPTPTAPASFWDACAASGGKSILAHDIYPQMNITVSDIRESILRNLRNRFQQAGIKKYHAFVADLTQTPPLDTQTPPPDARGKDHRPRPRDFDLILVDAPCTGSGTWSRTPEELFFFDPRKIAHYSAIQTQILGHIAAGLTPGSCLVYSTCSVFKKENEEIAAFLRENFSLEQDRMENIKGYEQRADSMFAARFRAPRG